MKIGMPTLVECDNFEENLKLCEKLKLDFVEINMNLPEYSTHMDVKSLKELLKKYNKFATIHIGERVDICEFDPIIRNGYLKHLSNVFLIAKALGVDRLNMHLSEGIHFKLPKEKVMLYERYEEAYLKNVLSFKTFVEDHFDGVLLLENTGILEYSFIEKALSILLQSPSFALTYDIGHDITSGYKDLKYYSKHKSQIIHYHIHDGTAKKNHLPLYEGELDIDGFLTEAKVKEAFAVIEVKSVVDLKASIALLERKNWL
ncbi:MAG: sugar phosphate isomerase/epimerase [Clostridia bacterium]|nr:sugar phosphate isomerase/epimerase [Clostridia bacterium]